MIAARDLTVRYAKDGPDVVRGVNFEVRPGEIFGLLGPSGAGKSTTQRVLTGLLKNFSGEARVLDRDLRSWGRDYYEHIGVVFELPNHYERLTAIEGLRLFGSFYDKPMTDPETLLDRVGLGAYGNQRVETFSKGMKVRLGFVRALLHDPEILFLDEPTSGLDPVNARRLKEIIAELKRRGRAILLTTHNMADADELCDRVGLMVGGSLAEMDAPAALKLRHGRRRVRVEYEEKPNVLVAHFEMEKLGCNEEFLSILRNRRVRSIHSEEATLADVFVAVAGAAMSAAALEELRGMES